LAQIAGCTAPIRIIEREATLEQLLPSAALALHVPPVRKFVISVDELVREALFGNPVSA